MNKTVEKALHRWDDIATPLMNFLVIIGIASVIPLLVFGIFAIFFVAIGGFPLWIWLVPTFISIFWYVYFFLGMD